MTLGSSSIFHFLHLPKGLGNLQSVSWQERGLTVVHWWGRGEVAWQQWPVEPMALTTVVQDRWPSQVWGAAPSCLEVGQPWSKEL